MDYKTRQQIAQVYKSGRSYDPYFHDWDNDYELSPKQNEILNRVSQKLD